MSQLRSVGAVLSLIQAVVGGVFIYLLNRTGMIPWKYVMSAFAIVSVAVLAVVLLVCLRNRKARIAAIVLSVIIIFVQGMGSSYLYRTMNLLRNSESSLKTDYLDIVVRNSDKAQELADTAGYKFGIVDDLSKDEKETLLDTIRMKSGLKDVSLIEYKSYSTALEAAKALLEKEVDVAVYREAYGPILEEVLDDYVNSIRVLENYEIRTEMEYEFVEPGEPFHMLISGIDVKGDISQASRSDVNIIVTINPKTKKILMTTTPRDYYVEIPEVSSGPWKISIISISPIMCASISRH